MEIEERIGRSAPGETMNGTLDLAKFLMAVLVVGIHTTPFGFNIWLDRGFGIITRGCVPFFFTASGYLFYLRGNKSLWAYARRIFTLYAIWTILYLPYDLGMLREMSPGQIIHWYFWVGGTHSMWYLYASVIGAAITYAMRKVFKPGTVLAIAFVFLLIGCMKSTWAPMVQAVLSVPVEDWLGSRNGVFYAFPYIALGMVMADPDGRAKTLASGWRAYAGLASSYVLLAVESLVFVLIYNTSTTILWISVFPLTYFFFSIVISTDIRLEKRTSLLLRKMSTLIYVNHSMVQLWITRSGTPMSWMVVLAVSAVFSLAILKLSEMKPLRWLKYLY